jgi:hypothetical protein
MRTLFGAVLLLLFVLGVVESADPTRSKSKGSDSLSGKEAVSVLPSEMSDIPAALQVFAKEDDLKRHPLNPWYYYLWGRWHKFEETPARNDWTKRDGRWYRSPVSNEYWAGGHWTLDKTPRFHPTNPQLWKVGGRWVVKPNRFLDGRWVQGPDGRWWRSARSAYYYKNGKWVMTTRIHKTNPTVIYRGGRWIGRPLEGVQLLWAKRYGRWWRCKTCHTYFSGGKWVKQRNASKRDNPFWRRSKVGGRYERIKPVTPAMRKYYRAADGLWYRSRRSSYFFLNDQWHKADPRSNDPRWRTRFNRRCGALPTRRQRRKCRRQRWVRLPRKLWVNARGEPWVRDGRRWWLDASKLYFWKAGRWVRRRLTAAEHLTLSASYQKELLRASPAPPSLHRVVNRATTKELKGFLQWFLKKYIQPTRKAEKALKDADRHIYNPERSPKFSLGRRSVERKDRSIQYAPGQIAPQLRRPEDSTANFKPKQRYGLFYQNPNAKTLNSGPK